MAKRKGGRAKTQRTGKYAPRPRRKSWLGGLLRFAVSRPVRWFFLIVLFVALLLWQRQNLVSLAKAVAAGTVGFLGWGLALIGVAILIILGVVWRKPLAIFVERFRLDAWNKWLGGASFILAVWGTLALFDEGGRVGLAIIDHDRGLVGILRVLALVALGIVLVAPKASFRALGKSILALARLVVRLVRRPKRAPKAAPPAHPLAPPPTTEDRASAEPLATAEVPPAAAAAPVQQRDLRQVAEEVWKKYGESPNLVTVEGWRLPPIDILDRTPEVEFGQADNLQRARLLEEALASYGVESKVVQINAGPTVTQFGVEPGWDRKMKDIREKDRDGNVKIRQEEISKTRVKVERITSLANDLALALAASSIRIEAPVPGKSVVGVEVPNTISSLVSLRGVIETSLFQKLTTRSKVALALGKGAGGEAVVADLTRMPHLLIAGATGSGKTVCLNTIICCLLLHNTPNDLHFIMIDPKRVELTTFNSIPHLVTPVIVDSGKALSALRWLNQEMDTRYQKMAAATVRNIEGYNKKKTGKDRLPYLVLIIDELADLMMTGFDEVEHILCRLAQLARATGIHLVVATQRPSVDVITGLIKANFPTRISFAVTSQVDSRTILDMAGAEKLLGKGDMLYAPTEAAKPKRLQGCYVADAEAERLVYFWNSQRREEAAQLNITDIVSPITKTGAPEDPLLEMVRQLAREHKHISASFLQRRLRIGYPRAARLMEQFEEEEGGEGEERSRSQ